MAKSSTLIEVAGRAGVSVITASRALRGEINVAAATRKKVLIAARELDYTPDVVAQTMRGGSSKLIGVFLMGFRSHVHHELLVGIDREANQRGYDLMVLNAANYDIGRTTGVDTMLKLCDGVMWLLPNPNHKLMSKLERGTQPCVLVNYARPAEMPVVIGANHSGAMSMVRHLVELGHQKIAFVAGTPYSGQSMERQRGYEEALREAGIPIRTEYLASGDFVYESGIAAAKSLLALPDPPSAIFCANDSMAMGALHAAIELGLTVPADVSIGGFDDVPSAATMMPSLTTVRQPLDDIGVRAVDELIALIGGRPRAASRTELPARLVIRGSTGPSPLAKRPSPRRPAS